MGNQYEAEELNSDALIVDGHGDDDDHANRLQDPLRPNRVGSGRRRAEEEEAEDGEEIFDEYDDEDDGQLDAGSDEYYEDYGDEIDGEEDDSAEEVQIQLGRNPNNMDRLSNLDRGGARGDGLRAADEMLSLNNLSVDMNHLGMGQRLNRHQNGHIEERS